MHLLFSGYISAAADKVAITNGVISIIDKNSNTFNYNIDNFDGEEHTIQITPIIYNKSGKSAFITYKQSRESIDKNVQSNGENIIELENQKGTYYIKNDKNLTSETEAVKNKKLVNNSTYADTINLSGNTSVTSLALGKPASKLKNYYIDNILITLPNQNNKITVGSDTYRLASDTARTIKFKVNSNFEFLSTDTVCLQKYQSDRTWSNNIVIYNPSISNNNLILTKNDNNNDKITLDLSNNTQVESVTCEISNTSIVVDDKYCITSISNEDSTDKNSYITITNGAYTTSGAITDITLSYTAKKYTYSLIEATSDLASYTKIQSVVNTALNEVINNTENKESGTYINSSSNFTTNNIGNASNIIMPNGLTVNLTPYNSTGTSFNTTVTYNYSNVKETITKYRSEIINKIL